MNVRILTICVLFRCLGWTLTTEDCTRPFSCYPEGGNELDHVRQVEDKTQCQGICHQNSNCSFFTYYDDTNFIEDLRSSCFTFTSCELKNNDCMGCSSGPPQCSNCTTPATKGGLWYCQKDDTVNESNDLDKCFYTCGAKLKLSTTCLAGSFDVVEERIVCPCQQKPEGSNVTCSQEELSDQHDYPGETNCTKTCSAKDTHVTFCRNGDWTVDFSKISCSSNSNPSLYLIIGLAVVGGLCLAALGVVGYFLFWRDFGGKEKQKAAKNNNSSRIFAYDEQTNNQAPRYIEEVPRAREFNHADEPGDRRHWDGDDDNYSHQQPAATNHYRFESLPPRAQSAAPRRHEERADTQYSHELPRQHPSQPVRLYQQSRQPYQGRGYRPREWEQPLSRGTSLADHHV